MNGYRWGGGFNRVGQGDIPWAQATSGIYKYIH
jgi:N-acetylmuramoyl-L-alanine amidase